MTSLTQSTDEHPIVFFDGECALCNGAVQRLLRIDRRRRLRYAPLQGETARRLLRPEELDLNSMVLHDARGNVRQTTAFIRILVHIGGFWSFAATLLWLVPRPLRNGVYRLIAANRYRWFGRHDACRLPQPGERELFLP